MAPAERPNNKGAALPAAARIPTSIVFASKTVIAIKGVATSKTELDVVFSVSDVSSLAKGLSLDLDGLFNCMPVSSSE